MGLARTAKNLSREHCKGHKFWIEAPNHDIEELNNILRD